MLAIAQFELTRVFGSRRGLLALVAYALLWLLLLRYAIYPASQLLVPNPERMNIASMLLLGILDLLELRGVADWLVPELAVFWMFSMMIWPLFSIFLTADQTASDRGRGTLRFLHLHATRTEIFFGRFLGQLLVQGVLVLATLISTFAIAIMRDASLLSTSVDQVLVVFVNLLIILLPYTALMALVSILAKSARQATIYAVIAWIVVMFLLSFLKQQFPTVALLDFILPGVQFTSLLRLQMWDTLSLAIVPIIQAMVLLLAGWFVVRRVDL